MPAPSNPSPNARPRGAGRGRALRAITALLIAAPTVAVLAPAVPAGAATYDWTICRGGNPVGSAVSGDHVSSSGVFGDQYVTPCHHNNNNHETSVKQDQLTTATNLSAPAGAKFTSMRINAYGNNYNYNNAWGYLYNSANAYYRCTYYDQDFGGGTICDARGPGGFDTQIGRNFGLSTGSTFLTYGIYCRQQSGCGVGTLDFFQRELSVTIDDTDGPTLSVGGEAWTSGSLNGAPGLSYSVQDNAVGGRGLVATIDGIGVLDTRNDDAGGCNYDYWHPCPDDNRSAAISLAGVPDGQRSMQIVGYDQLGNASSPPKTRSVLVDNVPPVLTGNTTLTGKAEQGEQLTCVAPAVNGQSPTLTYAWYRSKADGTGKTLIAGQTESRYLQTAADVGSKLTCLFKAVDGGGASSSESSITAGPFADGATVAPGKGPQPAGTTQITTSGGNIAQPRIGETLTIVPPRFSTGASIAYSWFRCDASGAGCVVIPGAGSDKYALTSADNGHRIAGQVVATDSSGTTTSRSEPSGLVTPASSTNTAPTADPGTTPGSDPKDGKDGKDGGSGVQQVVLSPGAANGAGACRDAKLAVRFPGGARTNVRYGRSATLRGTLSCKGEPIKGAKLALLSRRVGTSGEFLGAGVITTDKNGQFTRVIAKGPGRALRLAYTAFGGDAEYAAKADATMYVYGRIALKRVISRATRGTRIVFAGKLLGDSIPKGFTLDLEAQDGRIWTGVRGIPVRSNGTFRLVYRCKCNKPGVLYNFRVKIPKGTKLPYLPAASRAYYVRVR